jgi:hypothetical protein
VAYAIFDTPAIHEIPGIPGIRELAQAGSAMVPPLVIATARLLQVLDDSSVNITLPSLQDEFAVTSAHLPWTVNAWEPRRRDAHPPEGLDGPAHVDGGGGHRISDHRSSGPRSGTMPAACREVGS